MTKRAKMASVHDWMSEEHLWFSEKDIQDRFWLLMTVSYYNISKKEFV